MSTATKRYNSRQISPGDSPELPRRELSIEQQNGIDLLLTGQSDREVAATIGVSRVTVTRWRTKDAYFRAALNERRQALWAGNLDRLRGLVPRALTTLGRAVDEDPAVALSVVKVALTALQAPTGLTTPEAILDEAAKSRRPPSELDMVAAEFGAGPVTASERLAALEALDAEVEAGDGEDD